MNVVIPMAGRGARFTKAGFPSPKPFVTVNGRMLIEHVVDNVTEHGDRVFLVVRADACRWFDRTELVGRPNTAVVLVPAQGTDGAARSVLCARDFIDNNEPLLIANSDQYVRYDRAAWRDLCAAPGIDGAIMTFPAVPPAKWSYAQLDETGQRVIRVAEKQPISAWATVGVYFWSSGAAFVWAADEMIAADDRTRGEFYVCPVYNYAIGHGQIIAPFPVAAMFCAGTPEDLVTNQSYIGA